MTAINRKWILLHIVGFCSLFTGCNSAPVSEPTQFRFAVTADVHFFDDYTADSSSAAFQQALEEIKNLDPKPDFLMLLGDNVDGCAARVTYTQTTCPAQVYEDQYDDATAFLDAHLDPDMDLMVIPGNHCTQYNGDDRTGDAAYQKYMIPYLPEYVDRPAGKDYYSFNYGNTHFAMLATRYGFGSLKSYAFTDVAYGDQYKWVAQDLEAAASNPDIDNIFVCAHHPFYPMRDGAGDKSNRPILQERLWKGLFVPLGVDAFLHGHIHHFDRSVHEEIPMIDFSCMELMGAKEGSEFKKNYYGIIDIDDTDIQVKVYKLLRGKPSELVDSFNIPQR